MKGAQTVFLYRFMRFMKNNRGNGDLMKWMTRFQVDGRRLEESWMDLLPELDLRVNKSAKSLFSKIISFMIFLCFFMIWDMISGMIFLWFWEALLFHLRFL